MLLTDRVGYAVDQTTFDSRHIEVLETWIDVFDDQLPQLKNFILPVRHQSCFSTLCHVSCTAAFSLVGGQVQHCM